MPITREAEVVGARLALALAFVCALSGCDIVQGFQDAGDALFPPVKTYLDAPGYRLVSGGFRDMDLIASSELFLLARSSKEDATSLYSMRYADPRPCEIPDVGQFWAGGSRALDRAYIVYFSAENADRTLYIADEACRRSTFTLPRGELPPVALIEPPQPFTSINPPTRSLVLRSEGNLVILSADAESAEVIVEGAGPVLAGVGSGYFVYNVPPVEGAVGRVTAFDSLWRPIDSFGSGVRAWGVIGGKLYYEDVLGISYAEPAPGATKITSVDENACALGFPNPAQRWVTMHSPCDEKKLVLWDDRESKATELGFEADPWALRLVVPAHVPRPDPAKDPLWAMLLRNIDWSLGVGELVIRNLEGVEHTLGTGAPLERATVNEDDTYGYALIDYDGTVGRLLRWLPDGNVEVLAEGALREGTGVSWAPLIVDWNGVSGTAAHLVEGRLERLLERVPRRKFSYKDIHGRVALMHDYDGAKGTLAMGTPTCPQGAKDCSDRYYEPVTVARGVHHPDHAFLSQDEDFLPGIAFFTDFDDELGVGRFQYRNLELGFTSIVNEGVGEFLYAGNGLLYSVPFGERAGIWLARAK
jgi:hypothetical protein